MTDTALARIDGLPQPLVAQHAQASAGSTINQALGDLIVQDVRWLPEAPIDGEVRRTLSWFVEPSGYEAPAAALDHRVTPLVVLCGPEGTGRRSSGISLLARSGVLVQECTADWSTGPRADVLPAKQDARYLLDLSSESTIPESFGRGLEDYVRRLAERDAQMVILVTPELWGPAERHCVRFTFALATPAPMRVLESHLKSSDQHLQWCQQTPALTELITDETSHSRAEELARLVLACGDLNSSGVQQVQDAFSHWESYLNQHFKTEPPESQRVTVMRQRALLIAAAVLDRSPVKVVLDAADKLMEQLAVEPSAGDILVGPEATELLVALKADLPGNSVVLTEKHPGLDHAVLARVWNKRPQLQEPIRKWLEHITAEKGVAESRLERVAEVLVRVATEHGSLEILDNVSAWTESKAQHRALAISILERLAVDPQTSAPVRNRLRAWANNKRTGNGLLTAVAAVCGGALGRQSPPVALSRLRILSGRPEADVRRAAAEAVQQLTDARETSEATFTMMSRWTEDEKDHAANRAILSIADLGKNNERVPQLDRLLRDPGWTAVLQRGWAAVMADEGGSEDAQQLMRRWLVCADSGVLDRDLVIPALIPVAQKLPAEVFKAMFMSRSDLSTQEELFRVIFTPAPVSD